MKAAVFMLMFNLSISSPNGQAQDEIINVYSKRFDSLQECNQFLDNYGSLIRGRGVSTFQSFLKSGYKVRLKNVSCQPVSYTHLRAHET